MTVVNSHSDGLNFAYVLFFVCLQMKGSFKNWKLYVRYILLIYYLFFVDYFQNLRPNMFHTGVLSWGVCVCIFIRACLLQIRASKLFSAYHPLFLL